MSWWPTDRVRLRASSGRSFRAPTFTERFYHDPANLARPEVGPERSWSVDGGTDLVVGSTWLAQVGVFARRDRGVIDWLRATPADLWRTFNVHRARTMGAELSFRRVWANGSFVQGGYTHTDVSTVTLSGLCGAPTCLSKYVLDYAPHVLVGAAMVKIPGEIRLAPRLEYKRRLRNTESSDYAVIDIRASRMFGIVDLRLEGTNLANVGYQEVAGVAMPSRAGTVTLAITR